MKKTKWDLCPELKTSSMLLGLTLKQHYEKLGKCFTAQDYILDVGCGDGTFSKFIPNSVGVDEETNLFEFDLTYFNTLHFSESIGYLDRDLIEHLLGANSIKKIVIKDFLYQSDNFLDTTYWSYDLRTLNKIVLPLLKHYGYTIFYQPFIPNRERWLNLVAKYNFIKEEITGNKYKDVHNILVIAKR